MGEPLRRPQEQRPDWGQLLWGEGMTPKGRHGSSRPHKCSQGNWTAPMRQLPTSTNKDAIALRERRQAWDLAGHWASV